MNYSEFKKLINADPWSEDPEVVLARKSDPEFDQAALEAQAIDLKIQAAINFPAPVGLLNEIKTIAHQPSQQRRWVPLALAASILVAVSAVAIGWRQSHQWDSVEEYLVDHYAHDGERLMGEAAVQVPAEEVERIMASLNASAGQTLTGMVNLIKYCPTPQGRGVHLVVGTPDGPMTIVFMPETKVQDGEMLEFGDKHAYMVNLERGSAAIIGRREQPVSSLQALVRSSIASAPAKS